MRIRQFLTAILLLASLPANAAVTRNLYEASVPVSDQGADSRAPALRAAFETVLVRLVGARNLPPEAALLIPRASDLVQGYGYEAAATGNGLKLRATFDARAVDAALRAQGLPVWSANRPYHLAWIAVRDDNPPRQLLDAGSIHASAVLATAEGRGLPLNFPALDATERQSMRFDKVWDSDLPAVREASRRYASDVIVVGRVSRESGSWSGRWTLLDSSGPVEDWTANADTLDAALAAGIDALADREASRYAVQTNRAQELRVEVSGVQSVKDYGRALNYLRGLGAVRAAQVEGAQQDRLTFRLRVEGDPDGLARAIAAGNVLRADTAPPVGADPAYVLVTQ